MPVYIFHVWTNDRRSDQMNATKMHCSTEQVSAYVMVRCFNKENERRRKKKEKQMVRCVYFIQQLPSFAMAFFPLVCQYILHYQFTYPFFIFSIDGYKNDFLFTSLVFLCEFILCVLCLQQSTHLEWQLVQPMVSFEMYTCFFLSLMLFVKYVEDGFTIKIDCIALKRCLSNETMDHLSRFCI